MERSGQGFIFREKHGLYRIIVVRSVSNQLAVVGVRPRAPTGPLVADEDVRHAQQPQSEHYSENHSKVVRSVSNQLQPVNTKTSVSVPMPIKSTG